MIIEILKMRECSRAVASNYLKDAGDAHGTVKIQISIGPGSLDKCWSSKCSHDPILVYMSKVDGRFNFSPISVNFLTEVAKVIFALVMLLIHARNQKIGEKPLLFVSSFVQAAHNNVLLEIYYKNSTGGSELSTN
ncbi:hypothetical protein Lser_V15G22617 [Lactuca serriola]